MTPFQVTLRLIEIANIGAMVVLILVALGFLTLPARYLMHRRKRPADPSTNGAWEPPHILVQLPVFNEPHVVTGLLDCAAALDWPADRLHIQLLDDSFDETTAIAAAKIVELRRRGVDVEHVRRENRDGFKAGALAAGLESSDAPFLAILDADFRPPAHWLKSVVPKLEADPTAGFIQSRCEFANADENWLTRAQGLLLDSHFVMEQGVRAAAGLFIQFNGTGAVWRRAAIEAVDGWSSDSLSEDLNLSLRAALSGWRGLFAAEPVVPGLVPHRIDHWQLQQKRWSMGFAQNARTLRARIWQADWPLNQRISALFVLLYQAALPIVVIGILASAVDLACGCPDWRVVVPMWGLTGVMVLVLSVSMTWLPYRELRRGGVGRFLLSLAAVPPLVIFLSFSNSKAIVTGFLGREDIFHRTPKLAPALDLAKAAASEVL